MKKSVIELRQVFKNFGEVRAVNGVDLIIEKGEIFGLIGHNGAGKSTLFKMMLGLLPRTSGEIFINGIAVQGEAFRQLRRSIGYLPENVVFYDNLTGLETLFFFADLKGADRGTCLPMLEKIGLGEAANRRVRGYSKGMRQRLGLAQALLGNPGILFLDEPTTGLDPEGIREFYHILSELNQQGVTMVLTSHILAEIQERVSRLAVIKTGKIHALGTVRELREAMDLPLSFQVKLRAGNIESLRNRLANLVIEDIRTEGENIVRIRCHRQHKMAVLNALTAMHDVIADIDIKEPSLEDVFLGYAE